MSMLLVRRVSVLVSLLEFQRPFTPARLGLLTAKRYKRHKSWEVQMETGFVAGPAPIVKAGSLVLRQPAREVPPEMIGSQELRQLVDTMLSTVRSAPGVGLAATQIGVDLQVIVLEDRQEYIAVVAPEVAAEQEREPFEPLVIINPRLRALSSQGARFFEGCLSVPGYQALVERYTEVEVEGLTPEGQPLRVQARGWKARILQHEVDHLRGTLYVDRMLSRSFSARGSKDGLPEGVPPAGPCSCQHAIDPATAS